MRGCDTGNLRRLVLGMGLCEPEGFGTLAYVALKVLEQGGVPIPSGQRTKTFRAGSGIRPPPFPSAPPLASSTRPCHHPAAARSISAAVARSCRRRHFNDAALDDAASTPLSPFAAPSAPYLTLSAAYSEPPLTPSANLTAPPLSPLTSSTHRNCNDESNARRTSLPILRSSPSLVRLID